MYAIYKFSKFKVREHVRINDPKNEEAKVSKYISSARAAVVASRGGSRPDEIQREGEREMSAESR